MLSEEHTWNILKNYFQNKGLVSHQIDSFDHFLNIGIPKILEEEPDIVIIPTEKDRRYSKYQVSFSDAYIPMPTVIEENRCLRGFYPSEARQRDLTYDSPIYVTVTERIETIGIENSEDNIEIIEHKRVVIGRLPIMLRSSRCYLASMTKEERIKAGECEFDQGGYFIVKGKERVLIAQIRGVYNMPMTISHSASDKFKLVCEVRSMSEETGHSVLVQAMIGLDERTLVFNLPYIKEPIPIGIVFKALGYTDDVEICDLIGLTTDQTEKYLRLILRDAYIVEGTGIEAFLELNPDNSWESLSEDEQEKYRVLETVQNALQYIGKYAVHSIKDSERIIYAKQVIEQELFPHMGISATRKENAYFLGVMVNRLIATNIGLRKEDDRDNYMNKRVETSGILCYELVKQLFKKYKDAIVGSFEKKKQIPDVMSVIPRINVITAGLKLCFGTGKWGVPKSAYSRAGVSQILSRLSYGAALSHIRRLGIPIGKEAKNAALRQINPSQIMFICPVETPEGAPVGIVLNLSLLTRVSDRCPTVLIKDVVERSKNMVNINEFTGPNIHTKVFVNGVLIGMTENYNGLLQELRRFRSIGSIMSDVSITYDPVDDEIRVFSDEGRLLRPVLTVRDDHVIATEADGTDWDMLIEKGLITYVDNSEINYSVVAFNQLELSKYRADYCEIAAAMMLGVMASIIPFSNFSQSPRNVYQSAMGKQAMSMFALSHLIRADTVAHVLTYPQRPLVSTKASEFMGFNDMPSGINCVVAIACYTGYNQEDSVILNKSAVQRGLFMATSYHTYSEEEKKQGYSMERIGIPPVNKQRSDANYSLLDETGVVRLRNLDGSAVFVHKGDTIIGKVSIVSNKENDTEEINDCSVVIKKGEEGFIDRIFDTITPNGYRLVKIVIRSECIPELGDKFACYTSDHEVLTRTGWKLVGELTKNDKIACLVDRFEIKYLAPTATMSYEYNGNMYTVNNDIVSLCVTPNHRMFTSDLPESEYYRVKMAQTIGSKSQYYMHTPFDISIRGQTVIGSPKHIYVSDQEIGSLNYTGKVYCCTVPTNDGLIYVRRVGKQYGIWCGNSICAQKGTNGMMYDQQDMPFTGNGMVPDIILNPHAIPSRMTTNQLICSVFGKACAIDGEFGDATPFVNANEDIAEKVCESLSKSGKYSRIGREPMYNGFTGEYIGDVFIGIVYYQRLKHLVAAKMHARSTGPVSTLFRTPVDGENHVWNKVPPLKTYLKITIVLVRRLVQ